MKPLSERDENNLDFELTGILVFLVGMKPLSERDENLKARIFKAFLEHF